MGVLGALETILGLDDNQMKSAAVDIFSYIVEFSPSMVREFIVQEGQKQDDVSIIILQSVDTNAMGLQPNRSLKEYIVIDLPASN